MSASLRSPGRACAAPIIRCGCRLWEKAGRSAMTTNRCVHPAQSRMPRFLRDGQFNPTRCRRPRRHSTVRHNTVRCHRDNHNTVHRNMAPPGRRLDTVRCNLCRRSLPRWQRKVTRLPLRSRPGHRCRFILRASRQRKKTISIFSPVRHSLTAPHPPHGQAPCRRRIHRAAIRRRITRRPTLRQITRSKVLRRRLTHHAPSHCHPAQGSQFRSARRAHRWSPERLGRSK